MAAHSLYKPENAEQARKFCLLGATDIEIADLFEVSVGTIAKWKKRHPEFAEGLRRGKDIANAEVASKLYKRAVGYTYQETSVRTTKAGAVTTTTTKHCPPDVTACVFFLKNRAKEKWKDRHETEHTGNVTYHNLTDDELEHKIKQLAPAKPE